MNIGSIHHASLSQAIQQTTPPQASTQAAATKPAEEQTESAQERAKEAGKGERIDTHA